MLSVSTGVSPPSDVTQRGADVRKTGDRGTSRTRGNEMWRLGAPGSWDRRVKVTSRDKLARHAESLREAALAHKHPQEPAQVHRLTQFYFLSSVHFDRTWWGWT